MALERTLLTERASRLSVGDAPQRADDVVPVTAAHNPVSFVWHLAQALLALQFIAMMAFSTVEYHRFDLTADFATYVQAWTAIAHGHLDPYSTVLRLHFWRDDTELIMWPLAVLYWLYPHGVTLLYLQDLAVIGVQFVVLIWLREILTSKQAQLPTARGGWLLALMSFVLVVTPFSWLTIAFDFHMEPFAVLFTVLAARELYHGRHRQLLVWVPLALLSTAAGASYVIAVGLVAFLLKRASRLPGLLVVSCGAIWLTIWSSANGVLIGGTETARMYGYLVSSGARVDLPALAAGIVHHPVLVAHVLASRMKYVIGYLGSGGIVGVACLWGLVPTVAILLPGALSGNDLFVRYTSAFQNWGAVLFTMIGSAVVLSWISVKLPSPNRTLKAFGACMVAGASWVTALNVAPLTSQYLQAVSPSAVSVLTSLDARIPAGAEAVVSESVVGRFAEDHAVYPYWALGAQERFPVHGSAQVWFVLTSFQGISADRTGETSRAVTYVSDDLHAHPVEIAAGIWAFVWRPTPALSYFTLP